MDTRISSYKRTRPVTHASLYTCIYAYRYSRTLPYRFFGSDSAFNSYLQGQYYAQRPDTSFMEFGLSFREEGPLQYEYAIRMNNTERYAAHETSFTPLGTPPSLSHPPPTMCRTLCIVYHAA